MKISRGDQRRQKRVQSPWAVKFHAVVSHSIWVVETEFLSSVGAGSALN